MSYIAHGKPRDRGDNEESYTAPLIIMELVHSVMSYVAPLRGWWFDTWYLPKLITENHVVGMTSECPIQLHLESRGWCHFAMSNTNPLRTT